MKMTGKQLAEYYGVEDRTVTNWVNGMPACPSWKENGRRYFDSVKVAAWREAKARADALRNTEPLDLEKARARKMAADAELAELELARVRGEQVQVETVRETWSAIATKIRAQLLAAPGRYSARIVGVDSLPDAQRHLDAIVRDVLNELSEG